MFTGIITDIGEVLAIEDRGDLRARIGTSYDIAGIDMGASIACDGVCLTVVGRNPGQDQHRPQSLERRAAHQPGARVAGR
jgi:riboflavin synthase alpha subunit